MGTTELYCRFCHKPLVSHDARTQHEHALHRVELLEIRVDELRDSIKLMNRSIVELVNTVNALIPR